MSDPAKSLRDDRYAIVRVLGEGGQGTTFEAVDKRDGRLVAVKRFTVRGAKSWKEVELAEREANVLAAISHPAIPRHIEHFEEDGQLYLVTEKIEGESLAARKKRGGRLDEAIVARLLREAGAALDYLHGRAPPIVHRDLKPSNVILRPDGSFAFIDFGSVRDRLKPEGGSTVVGTFGYMAPEQFQGRAMPCSDVYSMGATALAMLTGREPDELPHKGLAIDVQAALRGTQTSPAMTRVLMAMLDPDPDRRAPRISKLVASLDRGAGDARRSSKAPRDKHDRRADREREREAQRTRRRELKRSRRRGPGGLPGIFLVFAMLGLTVAQIAVILSLRVAVPLALTLLSIVFGRGLREAAQHVSEAGKAAGDAILRARDVVRGEGARVLDPVRIDTSGRFRVRVDEDDAQAELAEEEAIEAERERRERR